MLFYFLLIIAVLHTSISQAKPTITSGDTVVLEEHIETIPTKTKEKSSSVLFPIDQLYPDYIANPLRSTFSAKSLFFEKTSIANTSRRRFDLKLGGRLGLYRKNSWQLTLEGGFHGQFDADNSEDNIGWDGIYALSLDIHTSEALAYRLGIHHISSHVGDELAERTGRQRINYTRQETRAGIMWTFSPHWQSYAEIAWGHDLRNKSLQRPWRTELGIQYEKPQYFFKQLGWYIALDHSLYEENNWDINTTMQMGIVSEQNKRHWRLGLEYYNGRSQLGEFFQDREKYIGIGIWIDI